MKNKLLEKIENIFSARSEKECIYVPSGRVAIYLAITEWLNTGDRILISPVNDDVVFWTILAAGLKPVLAPIDPKTGNINIDAIEASTWNNLQALMTTNLYGLPDNMELIRAKCTEHGVLYCEDACQAVDSLWREKRVGSIGDLAFYSFSKQVRGVGGVLAFNDSTRRAGLCERRDQLLYKRSLGESLSYGSRRLANDLLGDDLWGILNQRGTKHSMNSNERGAGHRMPYALEEVQALYGKSRTLLPFDKWVRVDNSHYRTQPLAYELYKTLDRVKNLPKQRALRIQGARKLKALGLTPQEIKIPMDQPLHRYPLFVKNREIALAEFAKRGLHLDYIYDPPLQLYAPDTLVESLATKVEHGLWSEHVLPVNPLVADKFIAVMKNIPALEPAHFN